MTAPHAPGAGPGAGAKPEVDVDVDRDGDEDDARPPLPCLQGERALLRALVPADAATLQALAGDAELARGLCDGFPLPGTPGAAGSGWDTGAAPGAAGGRTWAIVVDSAVIGAIGLAQDSGWRRCNAEVGLWLARACWRRGIGGDALRQVTDWAFAVLPELTRLHAAVWTGHEAAQALLRHAGFAREGVMRQSAMKDGQVVDRVLWAACRTAQPTREADIDAALAAAAANAMERS